MRERERERIEDARDRENERYEGEKERKLVDKREIKE